MDLERLEEDEQASVPETHVSCEEAAFLNAKGFVGPPENVRDLVGRHCNRWLVYDLPDEASQWCLASLWVFAYLRHFHTEDKVMPPVDWKLFDDFRTPIDICDAIRCITVQWRSTHQVNWNYLRTLEDTVRRMLAMEWNDDELHDVLTILARLWGAEYLFKRLGLSKAREGHLEVEDNAWITKQKNSVKRARQTRRLVQQLLRSEMWLGEMERYARAHGGIIANDNSSIMDFTRTHVQSRAMANSAGSLDLTFSMMPCLLVDHVMKTTLNLDWLDHCVVIDFDLMNHDRMDAIMYRDMPWLLLFAGDWYVFQETRSWKAETCGQAVRRWFLLLEDTKAYVHGIEEWDLRSFYDDESFPYA